MKINEIKNHQYYHGSYTEMPVGTILTARGENYHNDWSDTDFYNILEYYRPSNKLAHKDSVFMVADEDDIDLAGGATDYMFTLVPLGKVSKHDLNWSSEISSLVSDGHDVNSKEVKKAALNYWNSVPHHDENVWEYLTPKAKIIKVEEY